jgi:hypothetical protein
MTNQRIIFSIIENLHLESNTTFHLFDWTVTNNREFILKNIPLTDAILALSGQIKYNALFEKTIAFKLYDFKDNIIPGNFVHSESANLSGILSIIWLHFDNSIFSAIQISQDCKEYHVQINQRNDFVSNSSGNYTTINFSNETIDKIKTLDFSYFIELLYFTIDQTNDTSSDNVNYLSNAHRANLEPDFVKQTRIQRSFLIIKIARTTSFLPMKIAFYINVLECLLLNDNAELNFKLQLYTANLIGKNNDDKVFIRDIINTSYDIRSKFFHGSSVKQNITELQKISNKLDDIIRRTLLKSIGIKDIINSKDNKVLNEYLKSIMFS